uniref:Immune mapped protein 2 N-terminal domain-containing protein n=1 Tax=Cyclophora tenuis TaxID=216820 RepID=A0A6U1SAN0_CYCTE
MDTTNSNGPEGCYLIYESDSSGKLVLLYSRGEVPENAVGFWLPGVGKKIQGFKFKQAGGRSELIKGIVGGDSNRKKYFVGWCQFIKLAKAMNGKMVKFPNSEQGVEVDIYGFKAAENQIYFLDLDEGLVDLVGFDAVAVLPKHNSSFKGIKSTVLNNFLEKGNLVGATATF